MIRIFKPSKYGVQKVSIDREDFETYQQAKWYIWGTPRHTGLYLVSYRGVAGYRRFHRLAMRAPSDKVVDHINGNPLDNRKCNLRITSQANNNKNSAKRRGTRSSKFKGVHKAKSGKWVAQIQINGVRTGIGYFVTEVEAAEAYNAAAIMYYGEFAKPNKAS